MRLSPSTIYFSIPGRYAKALMEVTEDNLVEDFQKTHEVLKNDMLAKMLLGSSHLDKRHLIAFMDEFAKILSISGVFVNFLKLLILNNRLKDFDGIFRCYIALWNLNNNIRQITISAPFTLGEGIQKEIECMLANFFKETLKVDYQVNVSLLGGILVESEGLQIDSTVKQLIEQVGHHLERF